MQLHYFPIYGRAEPIRMILAKAKVEFEDVAHDFAEWPTLKVEGGFEFAQMPVLFVTDPATGAKKQYNQTAAILRYLGKKYGFYPDDIEDAWAVDSAVDATNDVIAAMVKIHWEKDEERKKQFTTDFATGVLPVFLKAISARLEHNASRGRFLVGSGLTIADFLFGGLLVNVIFNDVNTAAVGLRPLFEGHEAVIKYRNAFQEELAEYLAARPKRER